MRAGGWEASCQPPRGIGVRVPGYTGNRNFAGVGASGTPLRTSRRTSHRKLWPWEKGFPMSGSTGRRASSCGATLASKAFTLFVAFALAFGLMPLPAYAQEDGSDASADALAEENASSEENGAEGTGRDSDADGRGAAAAGSSQAADSDSASEQGGSRDGLQDGSGEGESADPSMGLNGSSGLSASSGSSFSSSDATADASPANAAIGGAEGIDAQSLSEDAYVLIQAQKDQGSTYSYVSGAVASGTELWANMYAPSGYYGADVVPSEGDWSYEWLCSDEKSNDADDYEPIEGQSSQSLTVTDELAGKYIAVKVTEGGNTHYGPRTSSTITDINANYLPGPVLKAGQAELYKVDLDSASPAVGDTLTAIAYTDWSTQAGEDVDVTFTWQQGDSAYGTFENIPNAGNGSTFVLTEAQQGKYIRVIANAGVNDEQDTTSDPVMAKGAVKLSGVKVEAPDSLQMPVTLTAKAYTGSSYSPDYVEEGVTYTWKYAMEDPSDYTFSDSWQTVEGETGSTLVVDDEKYAGAYFSVEANAGANTVELSVYSAVGPMKLQGQVDISAVSIVNEDDDTSVFVVGDTATARVREIGAPSGQYVDAGLLNFQWKAADSQNGDFSDIPDANGSTLEIDESLEGKYLRCVVSSKVGQSSYTGRVSLPVGAADAVHVTSVKLDKSGKVNVGDTITATASAAQEDVTSSEKLEWAWYSGDDQHSVDRKIEGADGNTLEVTDDLLGKYIEARADGGFGEEASAAVGPVVVPGAVELYRVEAVGDAKIGSTVSAKAYKDSYSTSVESSDAVSYQWQYAESNTTSDAAFTDIPGATQADFTIPETIDGKPAQGLYLRVKATSDGTVVSTHQKSYSSYYPDDYVDPLGPISLKGQYTLKAVELESSGQGMQAGNVITPTAMVEGSSYYGDDPAPADADLTFTWYAADAETGPFEKIEGGYDSADGKLALSADLAGKYVKVEASALDNTVQSAVYQVLPENTYDLLRVITSPAINGSSTLLTGDTVKATAYAKRFDSATTGDDVTDGVSIQWYVGDEPDGDFSPLNGATSAQLQIPADAAGKYLKVVATSGAFSVEQVSAACVEDAGSLTGLVATLENESWRPDPVYGADSNINDVLEAKLSEMGASDVQVRVKAVEFQTETDAVAVDVSSADDETNGRIAYAKYFPEKVSGWAASLTMPRSASITFALSRDGEGDAEFTPSMRTVIPWDEDACEETLRQAAQGLAIGYAQGDSADSVTQDVTLPHSVSAVSWKTSVSWVSESDAIEIEGDFWDTESTGAVTRSSIDQSVTLVATVGFGGSDVPKTTVDVPFEVTVKADQEAIAQEKAELQKKVDAAFTEDSLAYMADQSEVDADNVTGDLQLPNPRAVGVDGKYYSVTYSSSNDSVVVNAYAGYVYRPLPQAEPGAKTTLTLTVTSKENPEITASRSIDLTIAPLEEAEIEAELSLMEQAKEGYAAALLNGQDADAVTGNLSTFQKAYLDDDGNLAWARNYVEAGAAGDGIKTDDLEPDDDMGVVPGHWFKSSDAGVVAHDTLLVTQPEYNTQVTVSSALSSEKFARYAERYADDPVWGEKFAQLASQPVSATFTVAGTTGMDDPNAGQDPETLAVSVKVTGIAAEKQDGIAVAEVWVPLTEVTVGADAGATAWDVFAKALEAAGFTYSLEGGVPYSVTSPDGRTLAMSDSAPWSYWSFIVNGEYASVGADAYSVQDGDVIELVYVDGAGVQQPEGDVELNPDAEHPNLDAQWQGFAGGGSGSVLQDVSTATDGADLKWKASLLTDEERAAGASCASSDPLIIDGKIYVVSGSSTYDAANNWAETRSLARLQVLDPATGKVEREATLAHGLDSLCRMVYADGIIVIPLEGGYLQAVSAKTLETLWVVDAVEGAQNVSSLEVSDGYVYVITVDSMDPSQDYRASSGTIRRVNLLTGALAGTMSNDVTGYYWAGGLATGSYFLVGDDSGSLSVYARDLSSKVSSIDLGASVRCTLVESGGYVYAVTNNGVLHKLELSDGGTLSEAGSAKFADSSTSTPSISGGVAYVGGGQGDYTGVLAAIDLNSMTVVNSVQTFSSASSTGEELPADVKSTPLVSVQGDAMCVYFTCNNLPGALYCYKQGDAEATMLYLPESADQNYSMSSAFAGRDGTLYFINDSGNLFALAPGDYLPSWEGGEDPGSGDDGQSPGGSGTGSPNNPTILPGGANPLILTQGPTAQSGSGQDDGASKAEDSDEADDGDGATAQARALSASDADDAGAATQHAGLPSWLPFVGIAVGVCGLGAALAWLLLARKRSDDDEETR